MYSHDKENPQNRASRYSLSRYFLAIIDVTYLLLLLFLFQGLGLSKSLARTLSQEFNNDILITAIYFAVAYLAYCLLDFPINFYRSFLLERNFSLSRQKISSWLSDQVKSGIISYIISLILILAFYYILRHYFRIWWLVISVFWILFSLILAKLVPVLIIPLFFKYKRLSDEALRQRIMGLANKMKVKILNCFEIDFSKKTLKANAAFVGWGATRRVILADTLKDKYSHDEIEVILAHEFAHYKLKHLVKLVLLNSLATIALFYIIFKTSDYVLGLFDLTSLWDLAALPIVLVYFMIFGIVMQPLQNYISRRLEKDADKMALAVTGLRQPFISMMEKLSEQNLADRRPHPVIKFFFFDHPPVDERIAMAESSK